MTLAHTRRTHRVPAPRQGPTRYFLYLRMSRDAEGKEIGVQRQEKMGRELVKRKGGIVADVFCDNDKSASRNSTKPRPDYIEMMRRAALGECDAIAAYSSSRLTRRPREFEDLVDLAKSVGTEFDYVVSPKFDLRTADGRKIAGILAQIDAGEPDTISERALAAKAQARDKGWIDAGRGQLFGYADRMCSRPHEENAAWVVKAFEHMTTPGAEKKDIRAMFKAAGLVGSNGSDRWPTSGLTQILSNPLYIGRMYNNAGELIPAYATRNRHGKPLSRPRPVKAIVDPTVWALTQVRLSEIRDEDEKAPRGDYLLSGEIKCGKCGRKWAHKPATTDKRGYTVGESWHCGGMQYGDCALSRRAAPIMAVVDAYIRERLSVAGVIGPAEVPAENGTAAALARIEKAINATQKQITESPEAAEVLLPVLAGYAAQRKALARQAAEVHGQAQRHVQQSANVLTTWETDDPEALPAKRRILKAFIDSVYVLPIPPGTKRKDHHTFIKIVPAAINAGTILPGWALPAAGQDEGADIVAA